MKYKLNTVEILELLNENPTFKGINTFGNVLELRGENKEIINKKTKANKMHIAMIDTWAVIKPLTYDKANELYRRLRGIECIFDDGTRRSYRKLPVNGHYIMESDLPKCDDCLYYCYSYVEEE